MKAKMPEPIGYMKAFSLKSLTELSTYGSLLTSITRSEMDETSVPLFTTTQAEAYADARVREALEEAATIIEKNALDCIPTTAVILLSQAQAIRALIPKEAKS